MGVDLREEIESAYTADTGTSDTDTSTSTPEPAPAPVAAPADTGAKDADKPSGSADTPKPAEVEKAPGETAPTKPAAPTVEQVAGAEAKPGVPEEKKVSTEQDAGDAGGTSGLKPPQSWRANAKQVWDQLPQAVQLEVSRREAEANKQFQAAAANRSKIAAIEQVLAPHRERITAVHGGNPLDAIQRMLNVEQVMFGGSPAQKAKLVAKMIQEFRVDIAALDNELAGVVTPEAQQQSELEQLLSQKLQPVQQFMTAMQQREQFEAQRKHQEAVSQVESMAQNAADYPHFEELREEMADLVEFYATKGHSITLPEAYQKCASLHGYLTQKQADTTQAALEAHRTAQQAKGASVSVDGSPTAIGTMQRDPRDLRKMLAAAFEGNNRL